MKKYLYILALLVLGLFLASSLFHPGWFTSHDGVYHILRTEEALKMLKAGEFPLRWAGNFDEGYGIPLFNFVYPLPYYITATLTLFGMQPVLAVKILMLTSYLLGGLGIYTLFAKKNKLIGFFAGTLYLAAPYQFLNIFVRGALGEVVAMGIIPWVLLSFTDLSNKKKILWYHPLPLAVLLVSHNFLGILFLAFLLAYLIFSRMFSKKTIISLAISLGLSSFFLLPMVAERSLLYSFYHDDFTFRFDQHFIYIKQFLYGKWDYWYSLPGPDDGVSFQLGLAQILCVGVASLYILLKKRSLRNIFLVFAFFFTLFIMTDNSTFIWKNLPLLQTVQFPWRLLFMTVLLAPILGVIPIKDIKNKKLQVGVIIFVLGLSLYNVRNYRRPMKFLDKEEYGALYTLNVNKTATTFRTEILPKWSPPEVRYKSDDVLVSHGNIILEEIVATPTQIEFRANNKEEIGELTILRNYFPSWHVLVDGKNQDSLLSPREDGTISLMLVPGIHSYTVYMGSSQIETIANVITVLSLGYILFLASKRKAQ